MRSLTNLDPIVLHEVGGELEKLAALNLASCTALLWVRVHVSRRYGTVKSALSRCSAIEVGRVYHQPCRATAVLQILCMYNQSLDCSRYCFLTAMVLQPSEAHDIIEEEELSFALNHHHALFPHSIDSIENRINIIRYRVEVSAFQVSE